ncbi:phytanoyl-CoA dioxygenase family protein [Calditrichota bacterium GD2]
MIQFPALDTDRALKILYFPTPEPVLKHYNAPYPLTEEQVRFYQEEGYIYLPEVVNRESLAYLQRVIQAAVLLRKKDDNRALHEKSACEQSFLQCGYLCWDFKPIKDFVFGKRFAGLARDLLQTEHVRLWHDQALFKEPGGRATDVHIDSSYWPIDRPQLSVTLWLALNPVPSEKGCLYFYPKSHLLEKHEYVDIFNKPHFPQALSREKQVYVPLNPGDATFHSGLLYHGAGENKTDRTREGMTVIYIADGLRFDASDARNRTHTSCQGLEDGDIIDTRYTPILI